MPFVLEEYPRLRSNLGSWRRGGGAEPCDVAATPSATVQTELNPTAASAGPGRSAEAIDLLLYAAESPTERGLEWLDQPAELLPDGGSRCFGRVAVRYANLSRAEKYYIGGWVNTGPNNLFYRLFFDRDFHEQYDVMLWMEADMVTIRPSSAQRSTLRPTLTLHATPCAALSRRHGAISSTPLSCATRADLTGPCTLTRCPSGPTGLREWRRRHAGRAPSGARALHSSPR